ncbi:MAG: MFS transporter [Sciscionella sp.]
MPFALLALAVGAFGIGTTEFAVMGLLPQLADGVHASIPHAGLLISGYAIGVVIGAPLLTAAANRMPRKAMLIALMALFTAGNALSALSTGFTTLLIARVITALPHGAFFGVGSVVAAGMVPKAKRATAISMMFLGLTVANILGVPAATALGQHLGWRATFAAIAAIGVVAMLALALLVPRQARSRGHRLATELAAFREPQVWLALGIATFGFGGVFAAYSYIAPMLTRVAGFSQGSMTLLLAVFGLGMTVGNLIGGKLADRALMPGIYGSLAGLATVLGLFVWGAHSKLLAPIFVFGIGAVAFIAIPAVQTRIMDKAAQAPSLAAASVQSAFNIANAAGAWLGGLVIAAGLGYTAPNWVGAMLAATGLGLALCSGVLDRRGAATAEHGTAERTATAQELTPTRT